MACDAGAVSGMPGERSTRAVALAALAILVVLGPHPLWADEGEITTTPPFGKELRKGFIGISVTNYRIFFVPDGQNSAHTLQI